jgi:diacylglycerol kinase family enzyme
MSTPTGDGVLVIVNRASGASLGRADHTDEVRRRLPQAVVHVLADDETIDEVVTRAMGADEPPSVLGILGGDGSVSRAAHLARRYELSLLVLPNGTFNHFARSADVDDVETGLEAFERGHVRSIAVAEVRVDDGDPTTVLNAVSLGAYPEFLAERERRSDLGKWWGGAVAVWRELHGANRVGISRNGRHARVWSLFVGVGRNDPHRVATMQRATLHDAVLDVRVHHARGTRLRAMASLAFGRRSVAVLRAVRLMPPDSDLERIVSEEFSVRVSPGGAPDLYVHDGELEQVPADGFELHVRIIPDGLRVHVPGTPHPRR